MLPTLSLLYSGGSDYRRGRCHCTLVVKAIGKAVIVMPSCCHCRAGGGAGGRCVVVGPLSLSLMVGSLSLSLVVDHCGWW